jgi:hypothetical protein
MFIYFLHKVRAGDTLLGPLVRPNLSFLVSRISEVGKRPEDSVILRNVRVCNIRKSLKPDALTVLMSLIERKTLFLDYS